MALSMDDRLLGEKTHYYCSSSEESGGEGDDDDYKDEREAARQPHEKEATFVPEAARGNHDGRTTNTGPKGVINDWRRFKQLETEKRDEQEKERQMMMKKLAMTCRSQLDDENEEKKDKQFMQNMEKELEEIEDEFLKEYRKKRIEEMRRAFENVPKFGKLIPITADQFVEEIDKERPTVTIVMHLYEDGVEACNSMNGCMMCLAQEYPTVKFCKLKASDARLSFSFSARGVPALLIYKKGELIGNFVRLSDELGEDFFATDVESFLLEHGMLPDKSLSKAITQSLTIHDDDSGSDFDVD